MSFNLMQFFLPIFGLAINTAVHIITVRLTKGHGKLKAVITGFLAGGLSVLILESYFLYRGGGFTSDLFPMIITNLMIYTSLGYCYFHFNNLGETGRRVRILREIYDSEDGLTMEGILDRYNAGDIINVRLTRLLNNHQVVLKDNRYFIGKPVMLMVSNIIIAMKLIILGKRSEFD